MKEIANRLRQARLNKGLTQQQLADKMGYRSRSAICQSESDPLPAYEEPAGVDPAIVIRPLGSP